MAAPTLFHACRVREEKRRLCATLQNGKITLAFGVTVEKVRNVDKNVLENVESALVVEKDIFFK